MKSLVISNIEVFVSKSGRVFRDGKEMKYYNNGRDYILVNILYKKYYVHRLVMMAYTGHDGKEIKQEVNHKNGVKSDNRFSNLEWVTRSTNITHSYRVLKRVHARPQLGKSGKLHHRSIPVLQINLTTGKVIKEWGSIRQAAMHFNIQYGMIVNAITGRQGCKQSHGYKWEYA